jgi:hypothetical protein
MASHLREAGNPPLEMSSRLCELIATHKCASGTIPANSRSISSNGLLREKPADK